MKELGTNPFIQPHGLGDMVDICPHPFTQVSHFINERNFGRQKGVGSIFDQLGRFEIGDHKRCLDKIERAIDIFHNGGRLFALASNNNPIGSHEIFDGRAFPQEFGVGDNIKLDFFLLGLFD